MNERPVPKYAALACGLGFAFLAILVQTGLTAPYDIAGLRAAGTLRTPALTGIMRFLSLTGSGYVEFPLGFLFGAWLWRRRGGRAAGFYLGAGLLGWGSHALLKTMFARPRPNIIAHLDGAGWWSFPSGHAMASTIVLGLAVMLAIESAPERASSRWAMLGAAASIGAIAFSRVYLGVHYPSDVLAGLLAGGAWIGAALGVRAGNGGVPPAREGGKPPDGQTIDSGVGR
jgi:undecaprenyl-diphosphatase